MTTRFHACLLSLALAIGSVHAADTATPSTAASAASDYDPAVHAALLDPDSSPDARAAALKTTFETADAGNAIAAFQLAALFRSGPAHPAAATDRDPDTARFWLERCLSLAGCPRAVFATMAELLLEQGQPRDAMAWAQAAALAEREVLAELDARGLSDGKGASQSYHGALLKRVFLSLPRTQADEAAVREDFTAWLAQLEPTLQRIVAAEVDAHAAPETALLRGVKAPQRIAVPAVASQALFLTRMSQGATRADLALMIDGLPTPRDARILRKAAIGVRFDPLELPDGNSLLYIISPIGLDDGRFVLRDGRVDAAQ